MINKTFICSYNKSGICTFPGAPSDQGPDGLFETLDGGCHAKRCSGYTPPHKSKFSIPISKVSVCHTPLTVPSIGARISYFVKDINSIETTQFPIGDGQAVTNILSEWYENGDYPPMLYLRRQNSEKWGCTITGKFMGQTTGTHTFYVAGDGLIDYRLASLPSDTAIASGSNVAFTKETPKTLMTATLTSGQWYNLSFNFEQTKLNEGGYTILVDYTGSIGKLPLTAGMYCTPDIEAIDTVMPLSYFTLPFIKEASIDEAQKEGSNFTFSVPIVESGYGGYKYDNVNDYFYCGVVGYENSYLRKGELVKFELGFFQNDYPDLVTKFVGHIESFSIGFSPGGEKILNVECLDFINVTNDTINKNYPTIQTYWMAGLIEDNVQDTGYRLGTPAFDSWYLSDVSRALLLHAGIDSTLMNKRYEFCNRDGEQVQGTEYLMYATSGTNIFPSIRLERPAKYGGFDSELYGGPPDGEYFFKYGFGEKITDIIDELADNFGLSWGFRGYNDGAPFIRTINTPAKYYLANQFTFSGNWPGTTYSGNAFNIESVGGLYASSAYSGSMASINFTGTSLSLICPVDNIGTGYHMNLIVTRNSDGVSLLNANVNLNNNDEWHFYNGIYAPLGVNPTIVRVISGLPYGSYKLSLETLQTAVGNQMFNSVFVYEKDYETPEDTFNVIKYGDYQGNIISYNFNDSAADNRNDIVVIGKSKGIESKATEFNEKQYYYIGRGLDLRSIYDPTAFNYVGKYKSGLLVNNRITSDERASFIAFSILDRLRNKGKKIDLEIQGNPLLEPNDCFTVLDEFHKTASGSRWTESVATKIGDDGLKTSISCYDFKPYGSFISKPDVIVSGSNYIYKDGIRVINRGGVKQVKLATQEGSTTPLTIKLEFQPSLDKFGNVIDDLDDIIPFTYSTYPIPTSAFKFVNCYRLKTEQEHVFVGLDKYLDTNDKTIGVTTNQLSVGNIGQAQFDVGETILIPYDPYSSEKGQETFVKIQFQILKKVKIKVDIVDKKSNIVVATLTGNPSLSHPDDKLWESMDVGEHVLYWAGFDQYGEYNKSCPSYHYSMMPNFVTDSHRQMKGTPEAGMYVSEAFTLPNELYESVPQYGLFYVRFTFADIVSGDIEIHEEHDKPIYTRRGWGVFSEDIKPLINVLYFNDRHKHWSGSLKNFKFDNISDTGNDNGIEFYHSIIDTDNNNKGIGVTVHSYYDSTIKFRKPYYVPRTLKYVIRAKYYRISGMTVTDRRDGVDGRLAIWGDISEGPKKIESAIVQLQYNSTIVSQGDYSGDPERGNVYNTTYFSPSRNDELSFRTHAGGLVQGLEVRRGYEFFAWLVELVVEVQDLSGRSVSWVDFFQWFGQNTYPPYSMMGDTSGFPTEINLLTYNSNPYAPETLYGIYPAKRLYCLDWGSRLLDPTSGYVICNGTPADILGDEGKYWLEKERLVAEKRDIARWYEAGKVNAQVFKI